MLFSFLKVMFLLDKFIKITFLNKFGHKYNLSIIALNFTTNKEHRQIFVFTHFSS